MQPRAEALRSMRWVRDTINVEVKMLANGETDASDPHTWMELAEAMAVLAGRLNEFTVAAIGEANRLSYLQDE